MYQVPVVQRVDNTVHWISHYTPGNSIGFGSTYLMNSDSSAG